MGTIKEDSELQKVNLTEIVNVRFTSDEKRELEKLVAGQGGSISQLIRRRALGTDNDSSSSDRKEDSRQVNIKLAVKSLSATHKKLAGEYTELTNSFSGVVTSLLPGTLTSLQMHSLMRLFASLVDKTMEMQKTLNQTLSLLREKEIFPYAKPVGFSEVEKALGSTSASREKEVVRMTNLEFAVLTGKAAGKAEVLVDPSGNILLRFPFDADDFFRGSKTSVRYEVVGSSQGLADEIVPGMFLILAGVIRHDPEKVEPVFKATTIIQRFEDMQLIVLVGKVASDATSSTTKKGDEKMTFTLAVEDYFKGKRRTVTYDVGADRTNVIQFLKKGKAVVVTGSMHLDADSGNSLVYADNIELLPDKW